MAGLADLMAPAGGDEKGGGSDDYKTALADALKDVFDAAKRGDYAAAADAFHDAVTLCGEHHDEPDGDEGAGESAGPHVGLLLMPKHGGK